VKAVGEAQIAALVTCQLGLNTPRYPTASEYHDGQKEGDFCPPDLGFPQEEGSDRTSKRLSACEEGKRRRPGRGCDTTWLASSSAF